MRSSRTIVTLTLLLGVVACGGTPAGSPGASSPGAAIQASPSASEPSASEPSASERSQPATDPPTAPPDNGGIPDEGEARANAERLLARLTPPNATDEDRVEGPFELAVLFESTESFDALVAFYEEAIPDAGLQVYDIADQYPGSRGWYFMVEGFEFDGFVELSQSEFGYRVGVALLGTPPPG